MLSPSLLYFKKPPLLIRAHGALHHITWWEHRTMVLMLPHSPKTTYHMTHLWPRNATHSLHSHHYLTRTCILHCSQWYWTMCDRVSVSDWGGYFRWTKQPGVGLWNSAVCQIQLPPSVQMANAVCKFDLWTHSLALPHCIKPYIFALYVLHGHQTAMLTFLHFSINWGAILTTIFNTHT